MNWTPQPYQMDALKFIYQNCNSGIFLDPGMGKTSVTLARDGSQRASGLDRRPDPPHVQGLAG